MSKQKLQKLGEKWEKDRYHIAANKHKLRQTVFETLSGIKLEPLYYPNAATATPEYYTKQLGFPGEFPFTRGVQPTMYRGRRWTIRQYAGFGSASETNARYRYLLEQGTDGLSVAFDLPTQMGRDSDDPLAKGEVGRTGVAIDSLADMEILFDEIPLEKVSVSMTINATANIILAFYLALANKRRISWKNLRGTVQNDILKEYIARGTYIYPPKPAMGLVSDIMEFCATDVPQWNTISVSGYHIREAGSTAVQEIAFTLADGIAYLNAAIACGLKIDAVAPRIAFFFNCHNNFLEEIAKFRAARRLWARIVKERFAAKDERSCMLRFHTQTAGSSLTVQEPHNNIIRTTLQALAAVLGGTQSLHTNSFDEALGLPTEEAALVALRTQQIIAHESGVPDFIDPLGGSFALEQLTDEIEKLASEYLEKIDAYGGMVSAIEVNFPQVEIESAAYTYQKAVEAKSIEIIGLNVHKNKKPATDIPILQVDSASETAQIERLRALKSKRDYKRVEKLLLRIAEAANSKENLMPILCEAASAYITVGEISKVLRSCFGEYPSS